MMATAAADFIGLRGLRAAQGTAGVEAALRDKAFPLPCHARNAALIIALPGGVLHRASDGADQSPSIVEHSAEVPALVRRAPGYIL